MKSKYKNQINSKYVSDVSTKIRWKKTLDFLDFTSAEKALDVGDRTPLTDMMESKLGCEFQTTSGDLDELIISGSYEVITCFEVIEHLFNPLHFLLQCRKVLSDNGKLYLSMPTYKPTFLWSKDHFHEMTEESFFSLLQRSGFEIKRSQVFRVHPFRFYFTGIRPILRGIFDRRIICELQVKVD